MNHPRSKTAVGKRTQYTFVVLGEGRVAKVPSHRVRSLLKALGKPQRKPQAHSLTKNQWSANPYGGE